MNFDNLGFSAERRLISVSMVPHCGTIRSQASWNVNVVLLCVLTAVFYGYEKSFHGMFTCDDSNNFKGRFWDREQC